MELTCKKCGLFAQPKTEKANMHIKASCSDCDSFIKFLPQNKIESDFTLFFGKYKGRNVKSMLGSNKDEFDYLKWLLNQDYVKLKPQQIEILKKITL